MLGLVLFVQLRMLKVKSCYSWWVVPRLHVLRDVWISKRSWVKISLWTSGHDPCEAVVNCGAPSWRFLPNPALLAA